MSGNTKPIIYMRRSIPQKYIDKISELGCECIIEEWIYGEKEPPVTHDLSNCSIVLTLGFNDPLSIRRIAPNIKWVQSLSVGLEALLTKDMIESDILITNTKGCTAIPIAEHTIAMISGLARGVPQMLRNQFENEWQATPITDLFGATVGIIGYGEIGQEIAKRCKALGMHIIGCKRRPTLLNEGDPANEVVGMDQLDEVITRSDFLILALPSTKETQHIINAKKLAIMKPTSFLINIGRGNTIVEQDLLDVLQNKKIAGAALDVFEAEPLPKEHQFWNLDNIIISPHNAYYSPKTMDRYMDIFIENIKRFIQGKELLNLVDKQQGY